jgi:hypothetical protein
VSSISSQYEADGTPPAPGCRRASLRGSRESYEAFNTALLLVSNAATSTIISQSVHARILGVEKTTSHGVGGSPEPALD